MRVIKVAAFGLLGFILGLGLSKIIESGYLQPWEKLSTAPQAITEVLPTGDPPFFIRTVGGSTYRYESWQNEGWLPGTVSQTISNPFEVKRPCNFWSAEFLPPSNAPRNIRDCFQETTMYPDGYIGYAVVLDRDGNIWQWEHSPDINTLLCFPPLGLLMGLFTGFLLASQNRNQVIT